MYPVAMTTNFFFFISLIRFAITKNLSKREKPNRKFPHEFRLKHTKMFVTGMGFVWSETSFAGFLN